MNAIDPMREVQENGIQRMIRENAELREQRDEFQAACVAAIEATGGSHLWNGWTRRFLILAENALRKAGVDPASIESKDTVGPDEERPADNYLAWCRYANNTIVTCDSDDEGAFRVYRLAN